MNSSWRKDTGSLCLGTGHIQFYYNSLCHHGMHYRHHLLFPRDSSVSVCFSCLMLQKVSVYPVSFPNRLRRKERLFYLGFSRYIPAVGQAEPKQALSSQGNETCWSSGLPWICCPPFYPCVLEFQSTSSAEAELMGQTTAQFCPALLQPTGFKSLLCREEVAWQSGSRQPGAWVLA